MCVWYFLDICLVWFGYLFDIYLICSRYIHLYIYIYIYIFLGMRLVIIWYVFGIYSGYGFSIYLLCFWYVLDTRSVCIWYVLGMYSGYVFGIYLIRFGTFVVCIWCFLTCSWHISWHLFVIYLMCLVYILDMYLVFIWYVSGIYIYIYIYIYSGHAFDIL